MASYVSLAADDALLGQRIEMRRGNFLWMERVERHIGVTEIIGDDDDDVRLRGSDGGLHPKMAGEGDADDLERFHFC